MTWLNRWRKRRTQHALEAAQRADDQESAAARKRIAELARRGPDWNGATRHLPVQRSAPLLTPGQIDRSGRRP